MGTRRITYVIALVCSIAFYALYPFWFSWYLLVSVLLLIPFDLLFSLPGMCTKRIALSAPSVLEQGENEMLVITTYQKKAFPAGYIRAKLRITRDDFSVRQRIKCDPERGSRYDVAIDTSHSGITLFEIKRIHTTSMLGLFTLVIVINRSVALLILPTPVKPPHIVSLPRGVVLRPKPGGGFSEDSELRPYRKGDPIRIIHWKLSAKHDSLIIREPLIPPRHSRLVHIQKWAGAHERDLILSRFRWISNYLLKWELAYFVRLGDDGPAAEITCEKDFMGYLYNVLCNEENIAIQMSKKSAKNKQSDLGAHPSSLGARFLQPVPPSLPARFSWVLRIDAKEEQ